MKTRPSTIALLTFLVIAISVTTPAVAAGGGPCAGIEVQLVPFADEKLEIPNASTPLTASVYAPTGQKAAAMAIITSETAELRYRTSGSAPTTTVGHAIAANSEFIVCGLTAIANFRGIRTTSTSADIYATYFRAR